MNVLYQRSPRIKPTLRRDKLEILRPPAEPTRPTFSIITIIMTLVSVGFYIYMSISGKMGNSNYMMFQMLTIFMMLTSYTLPFFMYLNNKKVYDRRKVERDRMYRTQLDKHREELQEKTREQLEAMQAIHGDPEVCYQIVKNRSSNLWERGPADDDFMHVRIGTGMVPFYMDIEVPRVDGYERDPLIDAAREVAEEFKRVEQAPITLPLYPAKVIGIVGGREAVMNAIRVITAQLSTRHSPDEVKLAAFYDEREAEEWSWLRWLPHTWDDERTQRYLADRRSGAHQLADQLFSLLNRRKSFQTSGQKKQHLPCYVVLLSDTQLVEEEPLYPLLLEDAGRIDACTIVLSESKELLPMQCQLIVEVGESEETYTHKTGEEGIVRNAFSADLMSLEGMDTLARFMAPIRLKRSAASDIPTVLTLFEMLGVKEIGQLDAASRWRKNRYPDTLPVPVGVRAGSKKIMLNLHDKIERKGHGPHGLIAGTTGSGKSEVIQSLIASLAAEFHPHELAFMLIDYKGGGMSNTFVDLPHVVGTITNLDDSLIERAKVSLRAELIRRQRILNDAGNLQHIDEYYRSDRRAEHPLPHLVIIIDEFAQLKKDQPEFMDELISIATIGRTLGVHLILATQKPAGVVDEKIWSNTRFRICLRVQSEGDSRDMLKIPNAAWITNPGRGYFQVGSDEVFEEMQFAWSGAPYLVKRQDEEASPVQIYEVRLNGKREPLLTGEELSSALMEKEPPKQLQVFIGHVAETARREGIERLPGPWLPPLPEHLELDEVLALRGEEPAGPWQAEHPETELCAAIGLVDDLMQQRQEPLHMSMEQGHLAVYGMPGTGKTTFVQSLLMSLAKQFTPERWHGYVVDMGRMMKDVAQLPQIGSVMLAEEEDRIKRLFRYLGQQLSERKERISEAGVKTIASYRRAAREQVPHIVVVIDGYLNFRSTYPEENELLEYLLREGGSLAITFVITANRVTDIFEKVRSNIPQAVSFELADPSDYYFAVGRPTKAPAQLPPGRGLVKGAVPPLEFQTALPSSGPDETERIRRLRAEMKSIKEAWNGKEAPPIRPLPDLVRLPELLQEPGRRAQEGAEGLYRVPVGLRSDDLEPFLIDLKEGPHFVAASPMESGKTSFLSSWMLSLAYHVSPGRLHIYMVDTRFGGEGISRLSGLPHVKGVAVREEEIPFLVQMIYDQVQNRTKEAHEPALLLVMDDADDLCKQLTDFSVKDQLSAIVRQGRDRNVHVVLAGVPSEFPTFGVDWFNDVKASQSGFLFGTIDANDLSFLRLPISESNSGSSGTKMLPPGQGYFMRRKFTKLKAAFPYTESWTPNEWSERIRERWNVPV